MALAVTLRHPIDHGYHKKAGAQRRDAAKDSGPVPGSDRVPGIHVVNDNKKSKPGDAVVGIEDAEGRDR